MADIRLATDFFDHPKTLMLQADHGAEAILSLQRLWCWAATNRSKGILRGLDKKRLMIIARCSEAVIDSMVQEGFIDFKKNIYSLHNWKKNQSYAFYGEERSTKARKAAKARYSAKSKKKVPCSEHARGSAEEVLEPDSSTAPSPDPDPTPSPDPSPKKDLKPFDHFWATYPKKVGKGGALKVWNRLKPDLQTILTALEWQVNSDQWQRGYVPNPATYLNQERWTDEPQAPTTKPKTNRQLSRELTERLKNEEDGDNDTLGQDAGPLPRLARH